MSSPSATLRPAGITADRNQKELVIRWNDGVECRYTFAGLRAICPCVSCRGSHEQMGGPPDLEAMRQAPPGDLTLKDLQVVGTYALQFFWSDGHWTGIYTWEYLRAACPASASDDG